MQKIKISRVVPKTKASLINLVSNVESYPEFVPWCISTNIEYKNENKMLATMSVGFESYNITYTSEIQIFENIIKIKASSDEIENLESTWHFEDVNDTNTIVTVEALCVFRSKAMNILASIALEKAATKIVDAFIERCVKNT